MECNRDDAIRSKEIAESKFREKDFAGAKKFALKAKALFKPLEGIDQMIVALDVYLKAQKKIGGENDWYDILEVSALADEETIRKQYKKLAFQTHPDKNSFIGADSAFKLVSDAWNVLSDKSKRKLHDQRRYMGSLGVCQNNSHVNVGGTSRSSMPSTNGFCSQSAGPASPANIPQHNVPMPRTFWTCCFSCRMNFQYPVTYMSQYLKCPSCRHVFIAIEVPPPPAPDHRNEPVPMDSNNNMGATAIPRDTMPGTGGPSGIQNHDPMLPRCSFPRSAAGAHTSTHPVQRTDGTVPGSSLGSSIPVANACPRKFTATKEKEVAKKRYKKVVLPSTCSGPDGDSSSQVHAATKETEVAKKRYKKVVLQPTSSGLDGDSSSKMHMAKRKPRSSDQTSGKKRRKESCACLNGESAGTSFSKVIQQLDNRSILIGKMKLQLGNKLEEFKRKKASLEEDNAKKLASKTASSDDKERMQSSRQVDLEEMESWEWTKPEIRFVYTRRNLKDQKTSSDESSDEMPVPDADFCNFGDHPESSFQKDQVWATYDEEDGMPRYYALIRKVHTTRPFKIRLAFLKADDCDEFGTSNWISCGYSKTCGDFRPGASKDIDQLNIFSHVVTSEKGPGRIIRILPTKGDIWALYQNWSADWDEFTPDETMYKYELVQVLDSYSPSEGISVMPIVKVPGFVSVFKPLLDPTKSRRIPKEEMMRFSHQVPFHVLTGEEAQNSPKGCYELDPGSTPKERLQVVPACNDTT
ncbi:uncharacterized protein LOC100824377 [Brachypodium distachyon]|uniref:J domain-containing protein n=1 Tax=Brachypodium distachyon TaxID=15368 RepID=A0A0Q3RDL3_BRADI|nr:uncharacterized protein LOC100824377 [Brachypodium distachyon]KQK11282.1 hypothetical protein BRADI_2g59195v3 [Brachypodium distachyon]|eukprot:XP_024315276.1 uncharacterized protein LOC100824377 [Brachypodium distachyon]